MVTKEDLAQAILELKASQEKTEKRFIKIEETIRVLKEEQETIRYKEFDLDIYAYDLTENEIAEEFFYNSLADKPILNGIHYDFIDKNRTRSNKNGIEDEYDILLVNSKDIAIVEVKHKAHSNDVEKLVNKKYENFKELYPEYKDYNHHLGLASFNMNDDVKKIAAQNNVILLQRKGELIETIVPTV